MLKIVAYRIALLTAIFTLLSCQGIVYAQTETPEPTVQEKKITPTEKPASTTDSTLKSLKEKIESKVEEINKKTKKIIKGTITSLKDSTITVKTSENKDFTISVDDTITKIYLSSFDGQEEIEQSDIKTGDYILATGPVIENQVSANILYKQTQYLLVQGQITAVDKEAFTVDIITQAKDHYTLDIEKFTTQSLLNTKDLSVSKAGFSKYQVGDTIHAVILKPKGTSEKASAIRILIIPQEFFTSETLAPSKASR